MLLTEQDIKELTGRQRPTAQVRWLKAHGWPFEVDADGRPKVLRAVSVARLGGQAQNDGPSLRFDHEAA
jgi:hypothetical protein